MSKKYGNPCATYNIPLNNDDDDVFRTGCVHLYNFLHCKSAEYKPSMIKMHLEFVDSPLMTEAEGANIEEQLEEEIKALKDALQQAKDDGNQLMDRIDKLGKNNSLDYDRINNSLSSSDNTPRQSVQQLEVKLKTLEDALKLENTLSINIVDKAADIVNNTSQDKSNKQAYDENNLIGYDSFSTEEAEEQNIEHNNTNNGILQSVQQLESRIKTLEDALLETKSDGNKLTEGVEALEKRKTGEQHNDIENIANASKEHHTCTISEENQKVLDLRRNSVLVWNPSRYRDYLDEAFSNVRELANEMNAHIADNSIIHIEIADRKYYVHFRDADSKYEFLKNRFIYEYNPNAGCLLRILDYTDCGIVDIENFQSCDLSLETAFVNVLGLAKKMGITNNRNFIDHIDVYSTESNVLTYSVRFNCQDKKNAFLQKKDILKEFPETKLLEFVDRGGHTSSKNNVNKFSMAQASANVIGVAELMGLSLTTDNVKRIYVLNTKAVCISLVVEFSSNDLKNKFLKKKSKLNQIYGSSSYIHISDIKTEGNIVSIKYDEDSNYMFTAISFIGLAKQLGFPFTPDQTERFFELSEFISKASS